LGITVEQSGFLGALALDELVLLARHPVWIQRTNGTRTRDWETAIYVRRVADWPRSSFDRFVRVGLYPLKWAASLEIAVRELEPRSTPPH
jgi:hypothetical protein